MATREEALLFEKHFGRAQGWLVLGKIDEAALALEEIPHCYRLLPPVTAFRCELYLAAKKWDIAAMLAKRLVEMDPDEPAHYIRWAYSVRRHDSIASAEAILRRARDVHPDCAVIPFNLACYAAQEGRFSEVSDLLKAAILIDPACEQASREDPDFEPYWKGRASDPLPSQ